VVTSEPIDALCSRLDLVIVAEESEFRANPHSRSISSEKVFEALPKHVLVQRIHARQFESQRVVHIGFRFPSGQAAGAAWSSKSKVEESVNGDRHRVHLRKD
jgi:hypothetical protein